MVAARRFILKTLKISEKEKLLKVLRSYHEYVGGVVLWAVVFVGTPL